MRRALGAQRLEAHRETDRETEKVDFLDWADHYVDQLDPLPPTPHDEDLKTERPSYLPVDRHVVETLDRLLGQRWAEAFKVGQTSADSDE